VVGDGAEAVGSVCQAEGKQRGHDERPDDRSHLPRLTSQRIRRGAQAHRPDPLEQQTEQNLRGEPGEDRVVAVVGQPVEVAERLPSLPLELDLPAKAVRLRATTCGQARRWRGREEHHVLSGLENCLFYGGCLASVYNAGTEWTISGCSFTWAGILDSSATCYGYKDNGQYSIYSNLRFLECHFGDGDLTVTSPATRAWISAQNVFSLVVQDCDFSPCGTVSGTQLTLILLSNCWGTNIQGNNFDNVGVCIQCGPSNSPTVAGMSIVGNWFQGYAYSAPIWNPAYVESGFSASGNAGLTNSINGAKVEFSSVVGTPPSSGGAGLWGWKVGDIVWNNSYPGSGNPIGWMCTTASTQPSFGMPGWSSMGNMP
jgi:hypothetical protein